MPQQWLKCAQDNFNAADSLRAAGFVRSAVSRSYYAAFAAAHAIILAVEPTSIGERGNLRHGAIHAALFHSLRTARHPRRVSEVLADRFQRAYHHRVAADYKPRAVIPSGSLTEAFDAARNLIRSAEGMLDG